MTEDQFNQAVDQGLATPVTPPDDATQDAPNLPNMDFDPKEYEGLLESLRMPRIYLSAVPTFVPKTFVDSIQYVDDGVTKKLCVYIHSTWVTFAAGASGLSRVSVHLANSTTIAGTAQVPFDTVDFDTKGEFDPTTSHQFSPQQTGKYRVHASAYFQNAQTNFQYALKIFVNNAEVCEENKICVNASDNPFTLSVERLVNLTAGDHLDIQAYNQSGAALTIAAGPTITYMDIEQINP